MKAAKDALTAVKKWLGIKSPSRRFRDEVGKMMALGVGVGFEDNLPEEEIESSLDDAIKRANRRVMKVTAEIPSATENIVRNITNNYTDSGIDYKKLKKAQKEAMDEANKRPIILNGRVINRAMENRKGVPVPV